jgi:hypothetical protein
MKENKIGDERADWVVPGSKHTICAWLKTHHLCLAQNTDACKKTRQCPGGHYRVSDFY